MDNTDKQLLRMAAVGVVLGVGRLLAGTEKITVRILLGRAIVSGCLAMSAAASGLMFDGLEPWQQMGIAAFVASMGTSFIEGIFKSKFGIGGGGGDGKA